MQRYIAFLRGINLGKRRPLMSQLKQCFEELGFADVETFIASGNVIFSTKANDEATLESRIEGHLEKSLGYDVGTFLRTVKHVAAIAERQVFADEHDAAVTVHVAFLKAALPPATARMLTSVKTPADEFCVIGREYFWLCRIRTSESKVWTLPEIKSLRLPTATMRNMTSIRKLLAKHGE